MAFVWREWRGLIVFLAVVVAVRMIVVDWNHVPSRSMVPTIIPGDRIVVDKLAYGLRIPFSKSVPIQWDTPKRSDVIVFRAPKTDVLTVKRVIGLPGDRVSWDGDGCVSTRRPLTIGYFNLRKNPGSDTLSTVTREGAKSSCSACKARNSAVPDNTEAWQRNF